MEITWLGQAGLLFETKNKTIIIDPYLSNSVASVQPQNYRRAPVDNRFLEIKPNVIVITHEHLDHLDTATLSHYLTEDSNALVLAPFSAWQKLRGFGGLNNNYVNFNDGTTWTDNDVVFRAVKAEHSDEFAIGVIISIDGKNYYVTGDTLYSEKVFNSLPEIDFECVFLPINGVGNNMNAMDAKRFCERLNAKYFVPIHVGMFDNMDGSALCVKNKIVPKIYEKIKLD